MTRILKALKIFSFEDLYIFTKLSFLENIKNNEISLKIFEKLCKTQRNVRSKSFIRDIVVLEERFDSRIEDIFSLNKHFKKVIKDSLNERDGVTDSISFCLSNFKGKKFKNLLDNLIQPDFIR